MKFSQISKLLGLSFWSKAIPAFGSFSIFLGYILLNIYYLHFWNFMDFTISSAVCISLGFLLLFTIMTTFLVSWTFDRLVAELEKSKSARWVIGGTFFILLIVNWSGSQLIVYKHGIKMPHISPPILLFVVWAMFCLINSFIWILFFAWKDMLKRTQSVRQLCFPFFFWQRIWFHLGVWLIKVILIVVATMGVISSAWYLAATYSIIPSRYGGGKECKIEFWVTRSAHAILSPANCNQVPDNRGNTANVTGNTHDGFFHYSDLTLLHENSDSFFLLEDCKNLKDGYQPQVVQLSKKFVIARRWQYQ
jgi:hypothetical protein